MVPILHNKDKSEKLRKIKGLSDLSLFFSTYFKSKISPKQRDRKRDVTLKTNELWLRRIQVYGRLDYTNYPKMELKIWNSFPSIPL